MHECFYACWSYACVCICACMRVHLYVCMCMHACAFVCMHACVCICMYVCMHACMYLRTKLHSKPPPNRCMTRWLAHTHTYTHNKQPHTSQAHSGRHIHRGWYTRPNMHSSPPHNRSMALLRSLQRGRLLARPTGRPGRSVCTTWLLYREITVLYRRSFTIFVPCRLGGQTWWFQAVWHTYTVTYESCFWVSD
jgi:hypothetical protein